MSEIEEKIVTEEEPVLMEKDEYLEYLANQVKDIPEEEKHPIAQISMYQMNKDLVRGLKKMTNMEINNALDKVKDWFWKQNVACRHFALLNHEKHYYTIFEAGPNWEKPITSVRKKVDDSFIAEVKDVITNYYGDNDIRAIDIDTNGAVEIWGMWDGEPTVAYLFPYEQGVVYY